jgi:hypothetical protein
MTHGQRPIRREKGLFRGDKSVTVTILDTGGHPLAIVGRYLDELDESRDGTWISRPQGLAPWPSEDGRKWGFACKACRDQGLGWTFAASIDEVASVVTALWRESRADDTPRRRTFTVEPL